MSLVLVLHWFKAFDKYSHTPIPCSGLDPYPQVTLYIVKSATPLGLWVLPPKPCGHHICDQTTIKVLHSGTPLSLSHLFCHGLPSRTGPGITLPSVIQHCLWCHYKTSGFVSCACWHPCAPSYCMAQGGSSYMPPYIKMQKISSSSWTIALIMEKVMKCSWLCCGLGTLKADFPKSVQEC